MIRVATRISSLALLSMSAALAIPAGAKAAETLPILPTSSTANTPLQLSDGDKARYNAIFAALRDQKWSDAKAMILAAFAPLSALTPVFTERTGGDVSLSSTINSITILISTIIITTLLVVL